MLNNPLVWWVTTVMIFVVSNQCMCLYAEKSGIEYWKDLPERARIVRKIIFWNNMLMVILSAMVTINWLSGFQFFPETYELDHYGYPVVAIVLVVFVIWMTREIILEGVSNRLSGYLGEQKLAEMKQNVQKEIYENRSAISSNHISGFPAGCFGERLAEAEKTMALLERIHQARKR